MKFMGSNIPGKVLSSSAFLANVWFIGILQLLGESGTWKDFAQATCLPNNCFCERPRDGLLRQPSNTWSNLSFTVVGCIVLLEALAQDVYKPRSTKKKEDHAFGIAFATVYGIANLILGYGSSWYHASLTLQGQIIDNVGMYLLLMCPALFTCSALTNSSVRSFILQYVVSNTVFAYACSVYPVTRRYIFLAIAVFTFIIEVYARWKIGIARTSKTDFRVLLGALFVFAIAFGIWILDNTGRLCDPDSVFQGHAVWHLLCGVSSILIYLYYHPLAFQHGSENESLCSIV